MGNNINIQGNSNCSKQKSCSISKIIIALCLLICGLSGNFVSAQTQVGYVITYGNHYLSNNNGSIADATTFAPSSCIWTGTSGGTFSNGGYNLYVTYNSISLNSSYSTNLIINNNYIYRYYNYYGNYYICYYICYYSNEWSVSSNESDGASAYAVTQTDVATASSTPTISGNDILTTTGTYTYNHTNASYQGAYTQYSFNGNNFYFNGTTLITPTPASFSYVWSLSDNATGYASVNANTGVITISQIPTTDIELTLTLTATASGGTPSANNIQYTDTKTIILQSSTIGAPIISRSLNTISLTSASMGASIYYTLDGSTPSASSTLYTGPFEITSAPVTIKAIAIRNSMSSNVSELTVSLLALTPPIISITAGTGTTTISHPVQGVTLYYTTDGSDPTTSSSVYSSPLSLPNYTTVKAIAVKTNYITSEIASKIIMIESGISSGIVVLNDYEDHRWNYYQADSPIKSPDPRNVKITYNGNGGAVSKYEPETTFVYFKTLEKYYNKYTYELISNPYSKRPKNGSQYQGFSAWRVVSLSGATITNASTNATTYTVGSTIPADTKINFTFTGAYTTNCTSAELVLEAVWVQAYVVTCKASKLTSNLNSNSLQGSSYETNFIVITEGSSSTALTNSASKPVTITMVTPDGATDYRSSTCYIDPSTITCSNDWRFEFINMNNNNTTITANNHNLTLGRGIANTTNGNVCANYVQGMAGNTSSNLNYHIKIESGIYNYVSFVRGTSTYLDNNGITCSGSNNSIRGTLGCDYDRSTNNITRMKIQQDIIMGYRPTFSSNNNINNETFRAIVKSGNLTSNQNNNIAYAKESFYMSIGAAQTNVGRRTLIVEGGQLLSIAGGIDEYNNATDTTFYLRMSGGNVRGSIYGAAAFAATKGHRKFVITGGTIRGWVAGGCNGTDQNQSGGTLPSNTYIYIGGDAQVNSNGNATAINTSLGGCVFGAGSGNGNQPTTGQVNNSTVVVADSAFVERDVYGGGNYGYTSYTANVYVFNGKIGGKVFGGSNRKGGTDANITMTDGAVLGGIYGGSNYTGTISNNVVISVTGGTIGASATSANIHGGGFGADTRVTNNVSLTIGTLNGATLSPIVYGDVYGGSALGYVNGTSYNASKFTNVVVNNGQFSGNVYGGGLGDNSNAANVYGVVTVTINGGKISGSVFGCNNTNGAPQGPVTVNINDTYHTPVGATGNSRYAIQGVYGGGNQAAYGYNDGPYVNVHSGYIKEVYGGGNQASVSQTHVNIDGCNAIHTVFGGGNKGVVTNNTSVIITGNSTIDNNVYGGGNQAEVGGSTNVQIGQ